MINHFALLALEAQVKHVRLAIKEEVNKLCQRKKESTRLSRLNAQTKLESSGGM